MNEHHYPPGAANDRNAPWNQPDDSEAVAHAEDQVSGGDLELTSDTLGEFLREASDVRTPTLTYPDVLLGPVSTGELIKLVLQCKDNDMVLDAIREIRARYLADSHTKRVIEAHAIRSIEEARDRADALADEAADRRHDELMERLRDAA